MTSQLQKQFFDTFGIEPKCVKRTLKLAMHGYDENDLPEDLRQFISSQAQVYHVYPEITDHILLELICVLASNPIRILFESMFSGIKEVELLKNSILLTCIANKDTIKHQVRTLFEEG